MLFKSLSNLSFLLFIFLNVEVKSQSSNDSINANARWNFHFQTTVISQYHPLVHALYTGQNSLSPGEELNTSMTTTLFFGMKTWKGGELYFNPEISGGKGFSGTKGIAGFPNGEIYRVEDPSPHPYIGRFYVKHVFSFSDERQAIKDGPNQIAGMQPVSYFAVSAGKFSMMDFFDDNSYSHDPRTQFFNWALMGNGAWDYPANTRGYTYGIALELVKAKWALRAGLVMVPVIRNGWVMDVNVLRSHSAILEYEQSYNIGKQSGKFRMMTYLTEARMGNYDLAINFGKERNQTPVLDSVLALGRTKFGLGINVEHAFSKNVGLFLRAGWNDGKNETWQFTEIDDHVSIGMSLHGALWNRTDDEIGAAQIVNGISKEHRDFLAKGGYGFILGDGALNYGLEYISEIYYAFKLPRYGFWLSPDLQFIEHPAYNKDRGPVFALGLRVHIEI